MGEDRATGNTSMRGSEVEGKTIIGDVAYGD